MIKQYVLTDENGDLILCSEYFPPEPLERLVYKSYIDIQLYANLGGSK